MPDFTLEEMRTRAYEHFVLLADPDCIPVLTDEEAGIVNRYQRAEIWTPSTVYVAGCVVQLYPRNGHKYICTCSGTSGATAPTWLTGWRWYWSVSDGTAQWQEYGCDYENVFDVRAAAHEAWTIKAGKASTLVTSSTGPASIQASLLHAQCRARALEFTPLD